MGSSGSGRSRLSFLGHNVFVPGVAVGWANDQGLVLSVLAVCEGPVINSAREDAARPGCGSPSALSPVWGPLAGRPTDRASGTGRRDRYGESRRRRELPRPIASHGVFPRETQG